MAKQAVRNAVAARLTANFTLAPILILNQDQTYPSDNSPWVRLEFPVSQNEMAALSSFNRETGSFRIVVATEIVSGVDKSETWCEAIATIFARQNFGGVACYAPTIREGIDDGVYFLASVIVPYRYEYLT
jgi:hypothetical protein